MRQFPESPIVHDPYLCRLICVQKAILREQRVKRVTSHDTTRSSELELHLLFQIRKSPPVEHAESIFFCELKEKHESRLSLSGLTRLKLSSVIRSHILMICPREHSAKTPVPAQSICMFAFSTLFDVLNLNWQLGSRVKLDIPLLFLQIFYHQPQCTWKASSPA